MFILLPKCIIKDFMGNCLPSFLNKPIQMFILCILIISVSFPAAHARGGKSTTDQIHDNIKDNRQNVQINAESIRINKENIESGAETIEVNTRDLEVNKENIETNSEKIKANKENVKIDGKNIRDNKRNIEANAENIDVNKDNSVANEKNIEINKENTVANKRNIEVNKDNIEDSQKNIAVNKESIGLNKENIKLNKASIVANEKNINVNNENIDANRKNINANKQNIETSEENIQVNKGNIKTNRGNIQVNQENIDVNRNSISVTKRSIEVINKNLEDRAEGIVNNRNEVKTNWAAIIGINSELEKFGKEMRANTADIASQKSLTEDNSIRLYEILIKANENAETLGGLSEALEGVKVSQSSAPQTKEKKIITDLNRLWMFLIVVLVFAVPLAYALINNHSSTKQSHERQTALTNNAVLVWFAAFLGYFVVGFGVMYGKTLAGWIGVFSSPGVNAQAMENIASGIPPLEFFLYQSSFAALFALLVSFILGKRLPQVPHVMLALLAGMLIFPVLGHWVWAGHFIPGNQGWLEAKGFVDNAGASVIHSAAAWFALIVVLKLGYGTAMSQQKNDKQIMQDISIYPGISIFLLWLGLIGFSAGILPISSEDITPTILNITLAAASSGMTLFLYHALFSNKASVAPMVLCGFVSGLVAISAVSSMVTPFEAILIGAVAGMVQKLAFSFLRKAVLRKPEQAQAAALIAVHGFAGVWGTLSVALLGTEGEFSAPDFIQLTTQGLGIAAIFVYSVVLASVIMFLYSFYRRYRGMRAALSGQTESLANMSRL